MQIMHSPLRFVPASRITTRRKRFPFSPHSPGFYPDRQDRQYDYPQHQQFQVSLHERQTAEKYPAQINSNTQTTPPTTL